MRFRVASRSADERAAHREKLNGFFTAALGEGKSRTGGFNPRGLKDLEDAKYEIAELIVQLVNDEVNVTDPTPFMVETTNSAFGDQLLWQEFYGDLRVTRRAYGSKALSQRLQVREWGVETTMKEIAMELPLEEIASGRMSASQAVDAMAQAVVRYKAAFVCDSVDAGVPAATNDRTGKVGYTLRYSGLTADNLGKAIDGLRDDADTPTIFGRHIALHPAIRGFTGFSDLQLREFEVRGQAGAFLGAPLVTLADRYSKMFGGHNLRTDRVYITGGTKGAVMVDTDVSFMNYAEVSAKEGVFTTGFRFEGGILVHDPYRYRIIEIA